jgi:hypothetical protein
MQPWRLQKSPRIFSTRCLTHPKLAGEQERGNAHGNDDYSGRILFLGSKGMGPKLCCPVWEKADNPDIAVYEN